MVKQVVRLIGALYGIIGLASLPGLFFFLIYGPKVNELSTKDFVQYVLFILGIPLLNFIICFLIMYSFWKLKRWGRYLAIICNSLVLGAIIWGFTVARLTESNIPPLTVQAISFLIITFITLGGIIAFCFRKDVKELMRN